ncbi:MAG: HAD hydrolase-like protein [Lachnospiraceae bacterium]
MGYDAILFDLDGTLTDSGPGILNAAEYTFRRFGMPVPDRQALRVFVGPPLEMTFKKFGIPDSRIPEAIDCFREYYTPKGYLENSPYPGIENLLARLRKSGRKLYVATSKVENMAYAVLNHFGLMKYFDGVTGSTPDGSRVTKVDVLRVMLDGIRTERPVLVGDTIFDVQGAAEAGLPCVGVSWGYGDRKQMLSGGAVCVADTMDELFEALTSEV